MPGRGAARDPYYVMPGRGAAPDPGISCLTSREITGSRPAVTKREERS
jgi:hypothetical protein